MTPRALAQKLLEDNRDEIARGVYRLMCGLVPSYARVDKHASYKSAAGLLQCVATFLADGDGERVLEFGRAMVEVRKLGGIDNATVVIATHVYLPVVRKAFLARASSVAEALAAYDAVEGVILPLTERFVRAIVRNEEETKPDARPPFGGAFESITVDDHLPEFLRDDVEP